MNGYKVEWSLFTNEPVISAQDGRTALTWAQACETAMNMIRSNANAEVAVFERYKRVGPSIYPDRMSARPAKAAIDGEDA